MEINFSGKKALVTGAGKGIGRAIAIALMKGGADTYAISRTQSDLKSLEEEVHGIHTICIDITDWELTKTTIKDIIKDAPIELLVNNAGICVLEEVGKITKENAVKIVSTNLLAPINITQEIANGLKESGKGGSVVNVSSTTSLFACPVLGNAVYSATKGGLDAVTRVMAMELGPHNIRVNSIIPTVTWTPLLKQLFSDPATLQPFMDITPLNRLAEIKDLVNGTLFLLSEKAAMITGVSLPVDGGMSAC